MYDFRNDFYTVLAPTWNHLKPQVGAILVLKIAQEPPKTPPETHLGARTPQTPKLASKWSSRPPKMMPQTLDVGSILASILDIF